MTGCGPARPRPGRAAGRTGQNSEARALASGFVWWTQLATIRTPAISNPAGHGPNDPAAGPPRQGAPGWLHRAPSRRSGLSYTIADRCFRLIARPGEADPMHRPKRPTWRDPFRAGIASGCQWAPATAPRTRLRARPATLRGHTNAVPRRDRSSRLPWSAPVLLAAGHPKPQRRLAQPVSTAPSRSYDYDVALRAGPVASGPTRVWSGCPNRPVPWTRWGCWNVASRRCDHAARCCTACWR